MRMCRLCFTREGERERGREGERERGSEGERKIGREGDKERGRERESTRCLSPMFWEAGKVAVVHSHRPLAHCSRGTPPYSQNALTYYVPLRILTATSLRVITSAPPYPRTPPHNALTHPASACPIRIRTVTCPSVSLLPRQKLDARLPGKGNSNSHGARPFRLIITMIKWIRTSRSSKKNSLSVGCGCRVPACVHASMPGTRTRVLRSSS